MNAIISIKPQFVEEIKAGVKRYEYRKAVFRQPVEKVFIYASSPISKVVGEFQPVDILTGTPSTIWEQTSKESGITKCFYDTYFAERQTAYAIEIYNLKIYDSPKELPFRAPQSFCYIDDL